MSPGLVFIGNKITPYGVILNVYSLGTCNGQTYYKVNSSSNIYIPASWVAPPDNYAIILPPPNGPRDVSKCSDASTMQKPDDKKIQSFV